jgi:hypothetical protein
MTMQKQERLVYEGHEHPLLSRPLEECLEPVVYAKVQSMIHDSCMHNSSLHRGYRGCWVVRNSSLWLEDLLITDEHRLAAIEPSHPRRGIASLFPDANGVVLAMWVSGEPFLGAGETTTHLYYRAWSEHLVLILQAGKVMRVERRSNQEKFEECRRKGDRFRQYLDDH